jgi:hypothetical protein
MSSNLISEQQDKCVENTRQKIDEILEKLSTLSAQLVQPNFKAQEVILDELVLFNNFLSKVTHGNIEQNDDRERPPL